jgi:Peptidase M50B-like
MQYLLFVRVATVAFIFVLLYRYDPALLEPFSNAAAVLHEWGHAIGASISGGTVEGYSISPDVESLFACTRGGAMWLTLLMGNIMSWILAYAFVGLGCKGDGKFRPIMLLFGAALWILTKLFDDNRVLDSDLVLMYLLVFAVVAWLIPNWTGAILIVFGFMNLGLILVDILRGGIMSDVERFSKLLPIIPMLIWKVLLLTPTVFIGFQLFMQVMATRVRWDSGLKLWKNWDTDKTILFITLLPEMLFFAFEQAFDWVVAVLSSLFDFRKK